MSSVLHPVGPEPARVYWGRRALVLGAVVVIVGVIVALIVNGTGGPEAVPAVTASASPAAPTMTTPSPSALTPSASPTATPTRTSSASPSPTQPPAPSCDPAQLRATLTGKQQLKPKDGTTFSLSLINGSAVSCGVSVASSNFELKIYSGTDRIWSSADCTSAVKPIKKSLAPEKAVEWKMTWNGRRSAPKCKNRAAIPRPGTYFATAQLTGAKPVQLRMILRG